MYETRRARGENLRQKRRPAAPLRRGALVGALHDAVLTCWSATSGTAGSTRSAGARNLRPGVAVVERRRVRSSRGSALNRSALAQSDSVATKSAVAAAQICDSIRLASSRCRSHLARLLARIREQDRHLHLPVLVRFQPAIFRDALSR